ncbi:hypothetical protein Cni_G08729 [Canna indica]|uniref:Uncharacterized protein n=1 Tax=Canna indica TaxID=4628 RepID=A0AAQ3K196_9LILI|nr:hypothetical protein Cni_G08729 [Canna indica]
MLRRLPPLEWVPQGLVSPLPLLRKSSTAREKKAATLSFCTFGGLPVPPPSDRCSKITSSDLVFTRECFIWERVSLSFVCQSREMTILISIAVWDPLNGSTSRLASADPDLVLEGGLGQLGKAPDAAFPAGNFLDPAALMSWGAVTNRNAVDSCINTAAGCSFKVAEFSPYPTTIYAGRGKGKKSVAVVRRSCRLLVKGSGHAATKAAKLIAARYDAAEAAHRITLGQLSELLLWAWCGFCHVKWLEKRKAHPLYPLILFFNRDEYHDRPTKAVAWWGEEGYRKILGGRDALAGGTWLGCTEDGRLAFLTNVLEVDHLPGARTRGDLPVRFLQSRKNPLEFAEELDKDARQYNGFNLVLADISSQLMVYISNRPKGDSLSIQVVPPGLHVLTNARLNTPWYKAQRLGIRFRDLLIKHAEEEDICLKEMADKLMRDTAKADRERLPNTGYDPEWEFNLSSIFVEFETKMGRFGTRSTDALSVKVNGSVRFYEKYLENRVWKERSIAYKIK